MIKLKMSRSVLIVLAMIFILGKPVEVKEKLLNHKSQPLEPNILELSFPLRIADRLPVEGRIVDLIRGSNHHLIWLNESGKITGYDWQEKKVIWNFSLSSPPLTRLWPVGEALLIQDIENNLLALSKEGNLLWSKAFEASSGPIINFHEKAIFSSTDGCLLALNPQTAEIIWSTAISAKIGALVAFSEKGVLAISQDGRIDLILPDGRPSFLGSVEANILPYGLSFNDYLFLGTQDKKIICWHLNKKKRVWSIQLGGQLVNSPLPFGKNLYVATSNAVIYCLSQKSGEIKWWRSIPSRTAYPLVLARPYLIVATLNPPLLAFDLNDGRLRGEFRPEGEICSSPLVVPNGLILPVYESSSDQGFLLFLEPDISVTLSSSLPSPQKIGTEIIFSVEAMGFDEPRYEFFLQTGDRKEIVQRESGRNTWTWLPLFPGDYVVGVRVKDKRKSRESTLTFQVIKDNP